MKQKLSVSLDKDLVRKVGELVDTGKFRNKSHLVEYSLNLIVKKEIAMLQSILDELSLKNQGGEE